MGLSPLLKKGDLWGFQEVIRITAARSKFSLLLVRKLLLKDRHSHYTIEQSRAFKKKVPNLREFGNQGKTTPKDLILKI
jgi:hypothetical protein